VSEEHEAAQAPDSLTVSLLQQMFDLWITPYLNSGEAGIQADQIRQALIVMPPEGEVEVLLNERATITAKVKLCRDITPGDEVSAEDIEEISGLLPFDIDPAAGWMAFAAVLGHGHIVSFDLRRDKPRVRDHVLLARDYVAAARDSVAASRPGPAAEAAFAAAELAVKAMHLLHVFPVKKRSAHQARLSWLNWYTLRDGNGSPDWFPAMQRLESLRPAARYSDGGALPDAEELHALVDQVAELVDHVAAHGGADEHDEGEQRPSGTGAAH